MVHVAAGYARQRNRLGTFACTTSVGPGATNMVTGAALATVNRLPVLLLPGDTFATRAPHPVLQQLEVPHDATVSVNDCLRPVSRFFERVERPEQLMPAALEAMRVLTDPAETGAVTLALPEDVQAEAFECARGVPRAARVDRVPPAAGARGARARGRAGARRAAAADRRRRRRHLQRGDRARCARSPTPTGIPVCETQAGRGALRLRPPAQPRRRRRDGHGGGQPAGARGRPRDRRRHALERLHDGLEVGVPGPGVRFVNINVDVVRRRQAQRPAARRRRARGARRAARGARRATASTRRGSAARARRRRPGATRSRGSWPRPRTTTRCRRRPRSSARSTTRPARPAWSCAPPARRPATCTSSGAPATRRARATTSSTATRAWATRSPAAWGSSSPRPSARCSCSSATART